MTQREAVIVAAARTAIGRRNGRLKDWHPVDLIAEVLSTMIQRTGVDAGLIEDVIVGCVSQVGEQSLNVGRNAALAAGFPETVPGTTVDRQCGSSQQAIHFAAQGVISGAYDIAIAAGVEFGSDRLNYFQRLTIRRYLSLVFVALVFLLTVLALWQ